jgi:formiminotetrahydrofolate cyclodeaminase
MPKTKNGTAEDRAALDEAHPALLTLRAELVRLIDRDAASYDEVVAAYRLPKGTDNEKEARKQAVQAAMRHATDVPLETARAAAALVRHGRTVAEHGNPNAKSDVSVAVSLAMAGMGGACVNVQANLGSVGDETYAAGVRLELETLMRVSAMQLKPAYEALGWKGHQPPW